MVTFFLKISELVGSTVLVRRIFDAVEPNAGDSVVLFSPTGSSNLLGIDLDGEISPTIGDLKDLLSVYHSVSLITSWRVQKTFANRNKSGGGSIATKKDVRGKRPVSRGRREVYNLSSSSETESLDNDDEEWEQHGGGGDKQNDNDTEGSESDGEKDRSI
ncbi:hypothetical protein NE237_026923 [Protea cynaroides]|uniref:Uncharacterized protein n=1 Tax=Protea cynaroides TaxID=273540 RepID=A0A9Q0GLL5_9MAGN|nr:hypothetical protein NE237_026923 [Protea cynaroides]